MRMWVNLWDPHNKVQVPGSQRQVLIVNRHASPSPLISESIRGPITKDADSIPEDDTWGWSLASIHLFTGTHIHANMYAHVHTHAQSFFLNESNKKAYQVKHQCDLPEISPSCGTHCGEFTGYPDRSPCLHKDIRVPSSVIHSFVGGPLSGC